LLLEELQALGISFVSLAEALRCPTCDRVLVYRHTVFNGLEPVERWDYYDCHACGAFEYRPRTRKLRRSAE
jgi:hypothetical protein